MKLVILAAGFATRLAPLTDMCAKPLLPIAGKPIIEHILDRFAHLKEIDEVIVVTNDRFIRDFEAWAAKIRMMWTVYFFSVTVVSDKSTTNANRLGAVRSLARGLYEITEESDVIVVAGDNLFEKSQDVMSDFYNNIRPRAILVGVHDVGNKELARNYGVLVLDRNQQVILFEEKPKNPMSTMVSTALYYFPRKVVEKIKDPTYLEFIRSPDNLGEMIKTLIQHGQLTYGHVMFGRWYDIGTIESYKEACESFGS